VVHPLVGDLSQYLVKGKFVPPHLRGAVQQYKERLEEEAQHQEHAAAVSLAAASALQVRHPARRCLPEDPALGRVQLVLQAQAAPAGGA
jgi:hypothetical protein